MTIPSSEVTNLRPESGAVEFTSFDALIRSDIVCTEFGAYPDGNLGNDYTAQLNACFDAAFAYGRDVVIPAGDGPVPTRTLNFGGAGNRAITIKGRHRNTKGSGWPSAGLVLKDGNTGFSPLIKYSKGTTPADSDALQFLTIKDLNLYGNKDGNPAVTNSYLVYAEDDTSAAVYPVGVKMENVHGLHAKTGAVYIGQRRQSSLNGLVFYNCGSGTSDICVDIGADDCELDKVYVDHAPGCGIYLRRGSQHNWRYVAVYYSYKGIEIAGDVTDLQWSGGSLDHNSIYGLVINRNTNANYKAGNRAISQVKFLQNGMSLDNGFPDVFFPDADTTTTFSQCYHYGHAENAAKRQTYPYHFSNSSARVRSNMCNYATTKFAGGTISNNSACIDAQQARTF